MKRSMIRTGMILMIIFIIAGCRTCITWADTEDEGEDQRKEIVLEVVEDIPAQDIDEAEVPMAQGPNLNAFESGTLALAALPIILIAAVFIAFRTKHRKKIREETVRAMEKAFAEGEES